MDLLIKWFSENYIEVFGTIASLFYLFFSIKQKILLWPLGLLSSALYVYIFYTAKIYADMALQIYYVVISIYGWLVWSNANKKGNKKSKIKSVENTNNLIIYLVLTSILLFVFLSQILVHYTDSAIPYLDALTTSLSIVATWMLAKRYIEHWVVWIFVDTISSGIYLYKGLYFTVFLYIVYTIMAIVGLRIWQKEFKLSPA